MEEIAEQTGADLVVYRPTNGLKWHVARTDGEVVAKIWEVHLAEMVMNPGCEGKGAGLAQAMLPQVAERSYLLVEDPEQAEVYPRFEAGDLSGARDALKELEAERPEDPAVLFNLGVVTEAAGDLELARSYYRRAGPVGGEAGDAARERLEDYDQLEAWGYRPTSTGSVAMRELDVEAGGAILRVVTSPPGAQVFVGAKDYGLAPVEVHGLDAGRVSLTAVLADHAPASRTVELVEGEFAVVELDLVGEVGTLEVMAHPGSEILVAGQVVSVGEAGVATFEVPVGTHDLVVTAPGRVPWEETISVSVNQTRNLMAQQGEAPGRLVVRGAPAGTIFVDGEEVGRHTADLELPAGRHVIEVRAEGFRTFREERHVGVEEVVRVDYELQRHLVQVRVSTRSGDAASVEIDGIDLLLGPGEVEVLELQAGSVHVAANIQHHDPFEGPVEIPAEDAWELVLHGAPHPGTVLVISSPLGAEVVVDGQRLGRTPLPIELPAGEATIQLELEGHDGVERVMEVLPGQEHKIQVRLTPTD